MFGIDKREGEIDFGEWCQETIIICCNKINVS